MVDRTPQKDAACDFLQRAAAGDIDAAYRLHVHEDFRHHNTACRGDRESLRRAMHESMRAMPGKTLQIRMVVEEGDRVCTLSELSLAERRVAVVHLFRFHEGRIIELWDVGQLVPADSPNENGPF